MLMKAIIPAAGIGSDFLPASKSLPKEMLPILEKPAIQYVIEEGAKSGIKNFVMVTGKNPSVLTNHFNPLSERDFLSLPKNNQLSLNSLQKMMHSVDFSFVPQLEPAGLGHAIWTARHAVGKEQCAIMLPDDIINGITPALAQLIKVAQQEKCNVIAVQEVSGKDVSRYGIISVKKQFSPNLFQVKEVVEKPSPTQAPSNLAIVGRYVLSHHIFDALDELAIGMPGELQLTDGIQNMIFSGEKVFAYKVQGNWFDVGHPLGLIKANIAYALRHKEYGPEMIEYLSELDREMVMMQGKAESLTTKLI